MTRSWLRFAALLLVGVFGLVGCGGDGDGDSNAGTGDRPPSDDRADGAVVLLDAGAEPRQTLRLRVSEGETFTTVMVQRMSMTMEVDGQPIPSSPLPDTRLTMEVTVDSVSAEGDISYSFRYTGAEAVGTAETDPAVLEAMQAALTDVQGITGSAVVSNRGVLIDSSTDISSVQDPNIRNTVESLNTQMEALTVPFPAEEVGTGATWETARDANLAGIETKVKMQFRLNSLDGDQYGLEVAQEVTAAPGPANVPGVPPGATVQVQDYLVKSTGTSEGTIASMLPARSNIAGAGDIRMQISSEGQTGNLVQHLEIEVSFESPT